MCTRKLESIPSSVSGQLSLQLQLHMHLWNQGLMEPLDTRTQLTLGSLIATEWVHSTVVWTVLDACEAVLMSTWSRLHDVYACALMEPTYTHTQAQSCLHVDAHTRPSCLSVYAHKGVIMLSRMCTRKLDQAHTNM